MDSLRRAAREYLKKADGDNIPDFSPGQTTLPDGLDPLWRDVLKHDSSKHQEVSPGWLQKLSCGRQDVANHEPKACENLLAVQAFLRSWGPKTLSEDDVEAANAIYSWAAEISLPSSEFAEVLEGAYSADGVFLIQAVSVKKQWMDSDVEQKRKRNLLPTVSRTVG